MKYIKFEEFLNESNMKPSQGDINESNKYTGDPNQLLQEVTAALPELSKLIKKHTGVSLKLNIELKSDRWGNPIFVLSSEDLLKDLGKFGPSIFNQINLYFWGGGISDNGDRIWFSPKVSYSHPSGGTNGTDVIWSGLHYDIEKGTWIEGRLLK